jgi:large subunit ribosomal protein L4e
MDYIDVFGLDGSQQKSIEVPKIFSDKVRNDLISRAVLAEKSLGLQPQGHYVLAGMQTTARYYGAMNSWRTGRHMGIAIRPREKLGGGVQGKVKRIPSAVKGKRAHPHLIEKKVVEQINNKEYKKAIASAVAATSKPELIRLRDIKNKLPIVISNDVESLKKTSQVIDVFKNLKLDSAVKHGKIKTLRKGVRRASKLKIYKKSILIVVKNDSGIIRAARNIPGVDACTVGSISAELLAPGGMPGRITVWSEAAISGIAEGISKISIRK